tara:strand:- start:134 stop:481 length:348 start_codon:yes stop_codon:yes gene_type:complete
MSEEIKYTFKSALDFSDFLLTENGQPLEEIKKVVPQVFNFVRLKQAMNKKPCGCGGQNVEGAMKKRAAIFAMFYKNLLKKMPDEKKEGLKSCILKYKIDYEQISFMEGDEEILTL